MHDAADPYATPLCAVPACADAAAETPTPKRPRGRPRRFDADKQRRLCLLMSIGLSRRAAARHVGVPPSSIVYAAGRDPAFAAQLQAAEHARANRPPELADIGRRACARSADCSNHTTSTALARQTPCSFIPSFGRPCATCPQILPKMPRRIEHIRKFHRPAVSSNRSHQTTCHVALPLQPRLMFQNPWGPTGVAIQ